MSGTATGPSANPPLPGADGREQRSFATRIVTQLSVRDSAPPDSLADGELDRRHFEERFLVAVVARRLGRRVDRDRYGITSP